jgi:hypothetical protein
MGYGQGFPPAPNKRKKLPIILASVGAVFLLCIGGTVIAAAASDGAQQSVAEGTGETAQPTGEAVVQPAATTTESAVPEETLAPPTAEATTAAPEPETTTKAPVVKRTTEAPAEPEVSVEQQNAIESAESYLDGQSFSRTGLIGQLKYEGYSTKLATRAVDSLGTNYKEQAAKSAASYLDSSSFSRKGLIEQLEYEGFTHDQAVYGVNQVM